jgi:acyl-[acyl-carrier-protein]-phospholipid O-acyltransferase/long-chain-fatty-acid--[acyl-carrier-protein] ligase
LPSQSARCPVLYIVHPPTHPAIERHDPLARPRERGAREEGIPELWVPKALLVTNQIPILGSGKVDDAATLEMAREARPLL